MPGLTSLVTSITSFCSFCVASMMFTADPAGKTFAMALLNLASSGSA